MRSLLRNEADRQPEVERIRAEYDRREREIPADFYASIIRQTCLSTRSKRSPGACGQPGCCRWPIADLGGRLRSGQWLSDLESFGARRENLAGIDLDDDRSL